MSHTARLALLIAIALAAPAQGALIVSKTADTSDGTCDSDCSLREAIAAANAASDVDAITFTGTGTYPIGAELVITQPVTITGNGSSTSGTVLNGGGAGRIFSINSPGNMIGISGLRVTNGQTFSQNTATTGGGGIIVLSGTLNLTSSVVATNKVDLVGSVDSGGYGGGGIHVSGSNSTLNLTDSVVNSNQIADTVAGANGGGIMLSGGANLVALRSTVSNNTAGIGGNDGSGAIYFDTGTSSITNSTISGNQAGTGVGGGLKIEGGTVTLLNTTIANNTAASGTGAGLFVDGAVAVNVKNSIITNNTVSSVAQNCAGPFTNQGANVEQGTTCSGFTNGNPVLGGLFQNGGPTATMALGSGSAAINLGGLGCPPTDQRGVLRLFSCDSGAFEVATGGATTGAVSNITPNGATIAINGANPDLNAGAFSAEYWTTDPAQSKFATDQVLPGLTPSLDGNFALPDLPAATVISVHGVVCNITGCANGATITFTTTSADSGGGTPPDTGGTGGTGGTGDTGDDDTGDDLGEFTGLVIDIHLDPEDEEVTVTVEVPGAGTLTITVTRAPGGRAVAAAKAKPLVLGSVKRTFKAAVKKAKVKVKLTKAARKLLAKKRKLKVRLRMKFTPAAAAAKSVTKTKTVTLRAHKKKKS